MGKEKLDYRFQGKIVKQGITDDDENPVSQSTPK